MRFQELFLSACACGTFGRASSARQVCRPGSGQLRRSARHWAVHPAFVPEAALLAALNPAAAAAGRNHPVARGCCLFGRTADRVALLAHSGAPAADRVVATDCARWCLGRAPRPGFRARARFRVRSVRPTRRRCADCLESPAVPGVDDVGKSVAVDSCLYYPTVRPESHR